MFIADVTDLSYTRWSSSSNPGRKRNAQGMRTLLCDIAAARSAGRRSSASLSPATRTPQLLPADTAGLAAATFAWGPARFELRCDRSADLAWLESFLRPWFDRAPPPTCDHRLLLVHDAAAFRRMESAYRAAATSAVACFSLDGAIVMNPGWTTDQGVCVFDEPLRAFYLYCDTTTTILTPPGEIRARFAAVRILRELTLARLAAVPSLSLHGGAFELGGRAVIVAGPKRAGKTTLLAYLLLAGRCRFIANDWVTVLATASEDPAPPMARGMPTVVRVREGSAALVRGLSGRLSSAGSFLLHPEDDPDEIAAQPVSPARPGETYLRPADFASRLGARVVAGAPLAAIFFQRPSGGAEPILRRVDPGRGRRLLERCRYGRRTRRSGPTLFGAAPGPLSEGHLARTLERVPLFEISIPGHALRTPGAARELTAAVRALGSAGASP